MSNILVSAPAWTIDMDMDMDIDTDYRPKHCYAHLYIVSIVRFHSTAFIYKNFLNTIGNFKAS